MNNLPKQYTVELVPVEEKMLLDTVEAFSEQQAVILAEGANPGYRAIAVNDEEIFARCENCGKVIMSNDMYCTAEYADMTCYFCLSCKESLIKDSTSYQKDESSESASPQE